MTNAVSAYQILSLFNREEFIKEDVYLFSAITDRT